jgi:hypothetical protein
MNLIIQTLQTLIQQKRESIADLFTLQTIQTELEYDLALIRLEFRYDEESDFLLYEAQLSVITSELSKLDVQITKALSNIEFFSSQISNL